RVQIGTSAVERGAVVNSASGQLSFATLSSCPPPALVMRREQRSPRRNLQPLDTTAVRQHTLVHRVDATTMTQQIDACQ
ncbi:MAG: hypothetical protein ACRDSS_13230, partial [Actinocrinis sp.]